MARRQQQILKDRRAYKTRADEGNIKRSFTSRALCRLRFSQGTVLHRNDPIKTEIGKPRFEITVEHITDLPALILRQAAKPQLVRVRPAPLPLHSSDKTAAFLIGDHIRFYSR